MSKKYYECPATGDGTAEHPYRPDLPAGYGGWVVCTDIPGPPTLTVLVAGNEAYHAGLMANPSFVWLADAGSRPADLPHQAAHVARARAWLRGRGYVGALPDAAYSQRVLLDAVLALHGRSWADISHNDVAM